MIKLDVQEYCHGCANFTADVKEPEKYYTGFDIVEITDTLVRCIHKSRRNHKLNEWHTFCDWIEELPYSEIITGYEEEKNE